MCKYDNYYVCTCNCYYLLLITSFYYSPPRDQHAASNSYRESFLGAMDDIEDIPQ